MKANTIASSFDIPEVITYVVARIWDVITFHLVIGILEFRSHSVIDENFHPLDTRKRIHDFDTSYRLTSIQILRKQRPTAGRTGRLDYRRVPKRDAVKALQINGLQ